MTEGTLLDKISGTASPDEDSDDTLRAAIYARTSSVSQQFGYSIDEQARRCIRRCELNEWTVSHVFTDPAVSGKDTQRPMFQKMLEAAETQAFDVLVFWKLDRFSRSIMHAVQLEAQFRDWDVALHSVTEQIDTTTPAGRFNFRNIANAAEFEREMIKQRTKMGHYARALDHKWPNSKPPFGFQLRSDGRLAVEPSEAIVVRAIFQDYLNRRSMPAVALELNNSGRPRRYGQDWSGASVGKILRNPIYTGRYSVGDVDVVAEEYQILGEVLYSAVEAVRFRFQQRNCEQRPRIPSERKGRITDNVLESYRQYLSQWHPNQ